MSSLVRLTARMAFGYLTFALVLPMALILWSVSWPAPLNLFLSRVAGGVFWLAVIGVPILALRHRKVAWQRGETYVAGVGLGALVSFGIVKML